ncbi:MAG: ribonuclease H-like domain-containing protein [Candidatus Hadarchaeota archaeon]
MRVIGLDVETMGLNPESKSITAIGLGIPEKKQFTVYFVRKPLQERNALKWLHKKIQQNLPCRVVTWRDFDVDFIRVRAKINRVSDPLASASELLDLHECALDSIVPDGGDIHLTDAANMFGLNNRKTPSREMPALYVRWLAGDKSAREKIISHCHEDIFMMLGVYSVLKSKCYNVKKLVGLSGPVRLF